MCIRDRAYVEEQLAAGKKIEDAPMGTGPYKFEEWVPGASYTLVKNEDYFDPERAAQNDKLVFKIISEESASTIALENGEVDLLLRVPTNDADKIRSNDKLKLEEDTNTQVEYFCVNADKAPFDDVKVRQALSLARIHISGTDSPPHRFPFDVVKVDASQVAHPNHAVGIDAADYQSQGVKMRPDRCV